MKQKLIAGILSVTLLLSLVACAQDPGGGSIESGGVATEVQGAESSKARDDAVADSTTLSQVGNFQAVTIAGDTIDQTIFANAKLTMVNVWATWCSPCVDELPDLSELSDELEGTEAQIIGIVLDCTDSNGDPDDEMVELVKTVMERAKVNYPCLIPDSNLNDNLLHDLQAFPTTWFVDREGNIVGDPVAGSNSKEGWKNLILERLAEVDR